MPTTADAASSALIKTMHDWLGAAGVGWVRRRGGAAAMFSGWPVAAFNGVLLADARADLDAVRELLDEVAATGVAHALFTRPGTPAATLAAAASRGLRRQPFTVPLMVLDDRAQPAGALSPSGLTVRRVEPHEAATLSAAAARGFEMPLALARQAITSPVLGLPELRAYVGEVDGDVVATAMSYDHEALTGVYMVSTVPTHRGRGFAAEMTTRCVLEGRRGGAGGAYLQASEMGEAVYARIGFRTVERWETWSSQGSPRSR